MSRNVNVRVVCPSCEAVQLPIADVLVQVRSENFELRTICPACHGKVERRLPDAIAHRLLSAGAADFTDDERWVLADEWLESLRRREEVIDLLSDPDVLDRFAG